MQLFQQAILFSENFMSEVKELLHFGMLESKLSYSKIINNNVNGAKMMRFIKTCGQYPQKFTFGNFFSSLRVVYLYLGGNDWNLGETFAWEA